MKTFQLVRDKDVTGVSGTGHVADGVEFDDGVVAIRWLGEHPSTVVWDTIEDAWTIHGHGGLTQIVYDGERPTDLTNEVLLDLIGSAWTVMIDGWDLQSEGFKDAAKHWHTRWHNVLGVMDLNDDDEVSVPAYDYETEGLGGT